MFENSNFQVNGVIQENNVIVSINPSSKYNFINAYLAKGLKVQAKKIKYIELEEDNVEIFEYLKLTMDQYILHSYCYNMEM